MKVQILSVFVAIALLISCSSEDKKPLLQYVDITIGTAEADTPAAKKNHGDKVDFGQTIPAVTAPFGMTQWTPQNRMSERKCLAPYYMDVDIIQGFRATHWTSGSCVQDYGSFTLMPVSDYFNHQPAQRQAKFLFDTDQMSPAYSSFNIPQYLVITEITATKRCGFFKFSWMEPTNPAIIFDVNSDEGQGYIKIDPERREVIASNPVHRIYNGHGQPAGFSGYMVARFDCDFEEFGPYSDYQFFKGETELSNISKLGAYVMLKPSADDVVRVKIGTSFTSIENARENLDAEIPDWDFNRVRAELENTWENLLNQVKVEGGTQEELTKFYTAIYHSTLHPRLFSDVDGSYPGFANDTTIHKAEGFDYYCDFSAWDTYRAQMPLLSLIAPKEYNDMVKSLVKKAEQGGWLPIFPMWNSYTSAMIGDHCGAIIGDAYMKGFDFDIETAWKYMRKNAFETPSDYADYLDGKGRRALRTYLEYGYIPLEDEVLEAFHQREQVSRTLEYAYNDWVLSEVAKKMGQQDDYLELKERARNYVNVFDPQRGWVNGRYADGTFTDDFDAGKPMPYITEGTPKHYTWYVPHDVEGLMELMDGKENYLTKLQNFIDNQEYWHGNEPSHQIPYMFNYADRWDLTQKTVKNLLVTEYSNSPGGLTGNDDAGQMSAWYVFSAMGFYPVCPGNNEYQLSSPVFSKVTLDLDKKYFPGSNFVLEAPGADTNSIFSSVKLNGKKSAPVIRHEDIQQGGKLVFGK
jgi:predicted alpha-1,2-mannosidase